MGAGRDIKGITVEIGGDVSGLQDALKGVNKSIKDTQSQLKDVGRLLKLDPGNMELLAQKQRLLTDAVQETKEKLETLKTAKQQADEQFKNGDISQGQYDALQREIAETEQNLKNLEQQAGKTDKALSSIGQAGTKMQEIGRKISGAGKAMMPVTAAVTGFGAASVAAMNSVDDGLDVIVQKTGATGESMDQMRDVFDKVAGQIPADFSDIGAAVGEVNTRLGFTGAELEKSSEQFLKFAKVNDTDVNTAVQLVTRAMGDAGISAGEYGSILDALTVAGQQSGISVDALATNLAKYGAPMRALGIDTQNAIALFAGWEKAGVNTEIAFSGMKKAISNWGKEGKDAGVEFSNVLQQIKEAPSIADATALAIEAFGAKAGPDLADAIQGGRFEVEQYIAALENSQGAVDSTYGGIVDGVDDVTLASQNIQLALHDVGETIMTSLGPILLMLAEKIKAVGDWFSGLTDGQQQMIITILGVVAALGPLLMIIGQIASGIGAFMSVISTVGSVLGVVIPAIQGVGAALAALVSPVTIVIAIIGALVAAFIYFWNTSEAFRNFWIGLWENIKTIVSDAVAAISNFFTVTLPGAWNQVIVFFTGIPAWWSELWSGIQNTIIGIWTNMVAAVTEKVTGVKDAIVNGINEAVSFITALPGQALQWGADIIDGIVNGIRGAIGRVTDAVSDIANRIREFLHFSVPDKGPLTDYESWMPDFVSGLAKGLKDSRGVLDHAVDEIASSLNISPQYALAGSPGPAIATSSITQQSSITGQGDSGDIIIPVYIGNRVIDELVIDAQTRHNFRSGGR